MSKAEGFQHVSFINRRSPPFPFPCLPLPEPHQAYPRRASHRQRNGRHRQRKTSHRQNKTHRSSRPLSLHPIPPPHTYLDSSRRNHSSRSSSSRRRGSRSRGSRSGSTVPQLDASLGGVVQLPKTYLRLEDALPEQPGDEHEGRDHHDQKEGDGAGGSHCGCGVGGNCILQSLLVVKLCEKSDSECLLTC